MSSGGVSKLASPRRMQKEIVEKLKEKLQTEKEMLTKELEKFASEDKKLKGNWDAQYPKNDRGNKEEEADDATEYENLISLEQSLELRLKAVSLALDKIQSKGYGKCEKCQKEIEQERLLAYPEARLCINCNKNN